MPFLFTDCNHTNEGIPECKMYRLRGPEKHTSGRVQPGDSSFAMCSVWSVICVDPLFEKRNYAMHGHIITFI